MKNSSFENKTAVVVDDELITRLDFSQMLSDLGFTVIGEAADGFDAVEVCKQHHPDLVLMDINMPVFNGLSATEEILRDKLAEVVVILSAFSDKSTVDKAVELGVKGYLVKPIDKNTLYAGISTAMAQSSLENKLRTSLSDAEESAKENQLIEKAKRLLAEAESISESDAHRKIQKLAMDKRTTMRQIAESIIASMDTNKDLRKAKEYLMNQGLSEKQAYKKIVDYAKSKTSSLEEAARHIFSNEGLMD